MTVASGDMFCASGFEAEHEQREIASAITPVMSANFRSAKKEIRDQKMIRAMRCIFFALLIIDQL